MAATYDLNCPIAWTLDIVGERWTLLLLRDLFKIGPRRFQDFQDALPGLTPSVLSARLKELESSAVVSSRNYADHPPRLEYFLTAKGRELGPVLKSLKNWGEKYG